MIPHAEVAKAVTARMRANAVLFMLESRGL